MDTSLEDSLKLLIYRWRMPQTHIKYAEQARAREKCAAELSSVLEAHRQHREGVSVFSTEGEEKPSV